MVKPGSRSIRSFCNSGIAPEKYPRGEKKARKRELPVHGLLCARGNKRCAQKERKRRGEGNVFIGKTGGRRRDPNRFSLLQEPSRCSSARIATVGRETKSRHDGKTDSDNPHRRSTPATSKWSSSPGKD